MTWKTGDADEFLEDIMTEHMCKWEWDEDIDGIHFLCCYNGCTDTMFPDEILKRVNATERLSAKGPKYGALKEALIIALHLLGHADFKNGNTGPNGIIDEGEVHACRLMDKIQLLVPRLYAAILEGKDET